MTPSITAGPLRRTLLYVPAHDDAMIARAKESVADVICLDLEDSVPPAAKQDARARARQLVLERPFGGRETVVRINADGDPCHADDLAMCADCEPDGIVIPKVVTPDEPRRIAAALGQSKSRLWCMIESAAGLLGAERIATASDRVSALLIGGFDLAEDLGLPFGSGLGTQLWAHTVAVVVAARAAGISAVDGVSMTLERDMLGFDGRACAPGQDIAAINALYSPSDQEVARAHEGLTGAHAYGAHIAAAARVIARSEQIRERAQGMKVG